jgi:hypothetical protein
VGAEVAGFLTRRGMMVDDAEVYSAVERV